MRPSDRKKYCHIGSGPHDFDWSRYPDQWFCEHYQLWRKTGAAPSVHDSIARIRRRPSLSDVFPDITDRPWAKWDVPSVFGCSSGGSSPYQSSPMQGAVPKPANGQYSRHTIATGVAAGLRSKPGLKDVEHVRQCRLGAEVVPVQRPGRPLGVDNQHSNPPRRTKSAGTGGRIMAAIRGCWTRLFSDLGLSLRLFFATALLLVVWTLPSNARYFLVVLVSLFGVGTSVVYFVLNWGSIILRFKAAFAGFNSDLISRSSTAPSRSVQSHPHATSVQRTAKFRETEPIRQKLGCEDNQPGWWHGSQ
jgi:hypothetical protein